MSKEIRELVLWKKGLSPFELKEFKKGLLDRIYDRVYKKITENDEHRAS